MTAELLGYVQERAVCRRRRRRLVHADSDEEEPAGDEALAALRHGARGGLLRRRPAGGDVDAGRARARRCADTRRSARRSSSRSSLGPASVKVKRLPGTENSADLSPEYEACRRLALERGSPPGRGLPRRRIGGARPARRRAAARTGSSTLPFGENKRGTLSRVSLSSLARVSGLLRGALLLRAVHYAQRRLPLSSEAEIQAASFPSSFVHAAKPPTLPPQPLLNDPRLSSRSSCPCTSPGPAARCRWSHISRSWTLV